MNKIKFKRPGAQDILKKDISLRWVSFFVVLMVYISSNFSGTFSWNYAEDVRGKPLVALYDTEKYVVEGLPKTVDLTLEGKEVLVKNTIKKNQFNVYADLSSLSAGHHIVNLNYDTIPSGLAVQINPKSVSVLIKEVVELEKNVQIDYINRDVMDSTVVLGTPVVDTKTVKVQGAKDVVNEVVSIKAIVDVSDHTKLSDYEATLYAMNKNGDKMDVSIEPNEIVVNIPYAIPNKKIPIKFNVTDLPEGKIIKSIKSSTNELSVFAPQEVLNLYESIPLDIPYERFKNNGTTVLNIEPPVNVSKIDPGKIELKLELADKVEKTIEQVAVGVKNLSNGLKIKDSLKVDVTVSGLYEVVEKIDEKSIALSVDVKDLKEGVYTLPIVVENQAEPLEVKVSKELEVAIVKK